jgi:TonB-dependent receptor
VPRPLRLRRFAAWLLACWLPLHAADPARRSFDLPEGPAVATLKRAAQQAGLEIVYAAAVVEGVRTPAVTGEFAPEEALARLVAGTPLQLHRDPGTGAFSVRRIAADPPSPTMKPRSKTLLAALAAWLALAPADPAAAQTAAGTLTGTVTDPQGAFVQGAEVRVEGTGLSATTDRTGRFRLDGVPAGARRVAASYLGLPEAAASVTVTGGATATADLAFKSGETVVLGAFVVESIAEGQARAINRQRASDTISNIVAADKMGELPDASVAEALARLPGIAVQKDLGEPRFITVRGVAADQNSVSLNGDRLTGTGDPTESRDNRAVSLHTLPTEMISGVEVTKALTPDIDADALGGNVNLLTKSSLELNRRIFSGRLEGGYNDIRESGSYSANVTYGDRLQGGRVGYLLSAAKQWNRRGLDSVTGNYVSRTIGAQTYDDLIGEFQIRHRFLTRTRDMVSGQVDFKTGDDATHYARALVTQSDDVEQRRRFRLGYSDGTYLPGTSNTVGLVDGGRLRHEDRDGMKRTTIYNLGVGGKWDRPGYAFDYSLAYTFHRFSITRAVVETDYRINNFNNAQGVRFNVDGVPDLTYNRANFNFPDTADPIGHTPQYARYAISNYSYLDHDLSEEALAGGFNLKVPARLADRNVNWKFGLRHRTRDKEHRPENPTFTVAGTPALSLADFLDPNERAPIFGGKYAAGPTASPVAARDFFARNPDRFAVNLASVRANQADTYTATEDITGAYAMGTTDLGRLRLVSGVRWERTANSYAAQQLDSGPTGAFLGFTPVTGSTSYDNFFPSLVGTFRARPDVLIRAAWTNTISRPNYSLLVPRRNVNDQLDLIVEGNGALKPLKSMNWDLSIEWYLKSAGILSAGVFHKDIRNLAFNTTSFISGGQYDGWRLTRPVNGPKGQITGVELAWNQKLTFLPAPFNGFGLQANYSFFEAEGDYPGRGTLDYLPGQVDKVYNVQLYYEKSGFTARVAYNLNGRYLDAIGANAFSDIWLDRSGNWDASVGYRLRQGWRVYLEGRNLSDTDKKRTYQGRTDRPIEQEFAGWSAVGGVRFEF